MTCARIFYCLVACLPGFRAAGQVFAGTPPSLHWKQIDIPAARVIFPSGMERQAEQVAAIVSRLSHTTLATVGPRQHPIDIVFQNQTTISNGFVQLAPFRSEFELTPDQNSFELGSLPWQKMLAIHEYRHVQQYNNYRVGLSRAFFYLFGEGGQELANDLSLPNWFWEGDAVYQETLVSRQGRGRLPNFFDGYRALWAAGKAYSWMKLRNGSLLDYTPNHYPVGYMLVSYGREKYGDQFWKKVSHDAAAFRGLFYPLQRSIRKYSGLSFSQFREEALTHFRSEVSVDSTAGSPAAFARNHRHFVADEEFPQFLDSTHLLFARTAYDRIPAFVIRDISSGREHKLRSRSVALDPYFSYRNGQIVYAGYEPDLRWGWRDYGVIRILNVQTGKEKRLSTRSKYFSPDLSPDGNQLVAVQVNEQGLSALHLLNSQTGALEKILPNPDSLYFSHPKYFRPDELVAAVRNRRGEMSLALVRIADGSIRLLTPFSMQVLDYPSARGDTVFFTAGRLGQDRLYASIRDSLFCLQLSHSGSAPGDYALQSFGSRYAWSTFTATGWRLQLSDTLNLRPVQRDDWDQPLDLQGIFSLSRGPAALLDHIEDGEFPVTTYPAGRKLINFHSWRPYFNDPDYSFSLVSENVLGTLQSDIFVGYNRNESYRQLGADATYGAMFPLINAEVAYTFDRNALYGNRKIYWNEFGAFAGVSLPFNLSRGRNYTNLQLASDLDYTFRQFRAPYQDSFSAKPLTYWIGQLDFSNQVQQALRQIYPRFAQTLDMTWDEGLSTAGARQFLASGYIYLPGLSTVHSLVLGAAFQQRDSLNRGGFSNNFPFSRGYSSENFYRMLRLAANYHFPLIYPDAGFGNLLYVLRVRANLYFDYTRVVDPYDVNVQPQYRSFGAEIYFDTQWWNELALSFGIRYSRLIDPDYEGRGPNQWEFILPINLLAP